MGVGTQEDADDDLKCRNSDDFDESDDDDEGLRCPISRCVFKDPVMIVGSGNTYERKCIETFFEKLRRNGQVLRDPLTNEPLSSSNNSSQKKASELITNWERRRAVQKYLEKLPLDKVPSGWETREVPKAKELIADEKRRKMGKVGIFLEQLEEIGRWTVTHAHLMAVVFLVALVFPLDLYSGGNPVWAAAGKNGRRGDGEEFNGGLLRALFGFGKNARGGMKETAYALHSTAAAVTRASSPTRSTMCSTTRSIVR